MADSPETSPITDSLTGVFNRQFFNAMLLKEVARATRHTLPLTMLLVDVDHLKVVNEFYGHLFGNKVLITLASILGAFIRQQDVVARYGPDDFMILLPHTDFRGGQVLRDRLQHRTADALSALQFKVSITVGVCQYKVGEEMETFIAGAEQALLRAKRGGDDDESSVPVFV